MPPIPEKLGAFYLGKTYDLKRGSLVNEPIMYDARDLTTHAICVGMTGSGKTGLCIDLLEEAALDNVPAIMIDPKGDITNLLLTFPDLRPEDFQPWINPDDARRKGLSEADYAKSTAETWQKGLADWDQGSERIRALKSSAEFRIYTPGSDAGLPVSILSSFKAPGLSWDDDQEILREQIHGTVSALLGLVGIDADPLRSREHILLSTIIENAWRQGQDLDLPKLINAIQKPPVRQIGIFEVDTFFPEKDRFGLAMAINNIIASPNFTTWVQGDALDVAGFLHSSTGKPRMSIFYIAHLSDAERMFFVTLLLEQVIAWMRKQSGTTSLRALLYMDEVFGYFPPTANPPSKRPLLTLMKQARAFGLGVVLTTQNPVDLDYKGLSNAGTWFIGKLQAERDKARLLDGLESVSASAGGALDRSQIDKLISSLGSRIFLLHNINQPAPVVFQTRWAMSYLRGPLVRSQIRMLMTGAQSDGAAAKAIPSAKPGVASGVTAGTASPVQAPAPAPQPGAGSGFSNFQPTLPPDMPQVFLPLRMSPNRAVAALEAEQKVQIKAEASALIYEPALLALGTVSFIDRTRDLSETRTVGKLVRSGSLGAIVTWQEADDASVDQRTLEQKPEGDQAVYAEVPAAVSSAAKLKRYAGDFADYLYADQTLELLYSPVLKLYGRSGEAERDFMARLQQAARERRDDEVDKLRKKYATQINRIEDRLDREQAELSQDEAEYSSRKTEEMVSGAETVIGMLGLFGRRKRSLSSSMTKRRLTSTAKADIQESKTEIARLEKELAVIQQDLESEIARIGQSWTDAIENVETFKVKPRKTDCQVDLVALAWTPTWEIGYRSASGALTHDRVPAWI